MNAFLRYFFMVLGIVVTLGTYTPAVYAVKNQSHFDTATGCLFRLALPSDINQLLVLQSQIDQDPVDSTKLVILPELFRRNSLAENISKARLFVVEKNDVIIAFVKLYIIQEYEDILEKEIRCLGSDSKQTHGVVLTNFFQGVMPVILYFGSEYTIPLFRGKHLGTHLMTYALDFLVSDIGNVHSPKIAMVYGKAKSKTDNPSYKATLLKRSFAYLLEKLLNIKNVDFSTFTTSVYAARMPVLVVDPERRIFDARENESFSDHGCVLSYKRSPTL